VFVTLGRLHAKHLPSPERVTTELELIRVLLHPGVRLRDPGELTRDLTELCAEAQRLELDAELSGGLSLLARAYHWGWGDIPRARIVLERALRLIEDGREPNLEPLLEAARCLAYLEMDMDRTARLFDELGALQTLTAASVQYQWGLGLVQAWRGDIDAARALLAQAIELAVARADHWVAFECMSRLALLQIEAGAIDAAAPICVQLTALAQRLGDGSERPYAVAIAALQALACREAGGDAALDAAVSRLEGIDARFLVPDLLGIAAELHQRAGEAELARARAERALEVAEGVARPFEAARAHAILACLAATAGQVFDARRHLDADARCPGSPPGHVEALRREAVRLIEARLPGERSRTWP
jgi:tetratricopeptide (TPR) repeat protein